MPLELKKVTPVELRSLGLDEKWLQDKIKDDPSLLGLGELEIAGREHRQPAGGRIDFLMRDAEAETYYEVEVMLGPLDETHIIRTVEYWDIERQRRPQFERRAVIAGWRRCRVSMSATHPSWDWAHGKQRCISQTLESPAER
jgi:hypothetical protein